MQNTQGNFKSGQKLSKIRKHGECYRELEYVPQSLKASKGLKYLQDGEVEEGDFGPGLNALKQK